MHAGSKGKTLGKADRDNSARFVVKDADQSGKAALEGCYNAFPRDFLRAWRTARPCSRLLNFRP